MKHDFKKEVEIEINSESEQIEGCSYGETAPHEVLYAMMSEDRSWGIPGLSFIVPGQTLIVDIVLEDKNGDYNSVYIKINTKDVETEGLDEKTVKDHIYPESLNLTLKNIVKVDEKNYTADSDGVLHF